MQVVQGPWRSLLAMGTPLNLAVLRITVPLVVLRAPETWDAAHWSGLRPELLVIPEGFGWIALALPIDPTAARAAQALLVLGCVAGAAGLFTRASLAIAALAGVHVLGLSQLGGTVTHNHHLIWLLALLAAAPSGDALSIDVRVDAWREARRGEPRPAKPPLAYALPLAAAWMLIGIIFFFPGFWKLATSGTAWFWSDNLRNQMYWKWYQTGGPPFLRIDRFPLLCRLGALATIAFELSFWALVFVPRLRLFAVAAALIFHALTASLMRISFPSLWWCYVMFVDWERVMPRVRRWLFDEEAPEASLNSGDAEAPGSLDSPLGSLHRRRSSIPGNAAARRDVLPTALVASVLIGGAAWFGARGVYQAWPFACYPTFQWMAGTEMPALQIEAVLADGRLVEIPHVVPENSARSQKLWGMGWSLSGALGEASETRLRAYLQTLVHRDDVRELAPRRIRFYRALYSVVPEDRGEPPVERTLLADFTLP